jgi:hypothetical protein
MTKKVLNLLAPLLLAVSVSGTVCAKSLADLQIDELDKFQMAELVNGQDRAGVGGNIAINLFYSGSSTESAVNVSSHQVIAYAPIGTADTNFGTSGIYELGSTSYDTIGELCDAIDALSDYACTMKGAKRDDASTLLYDVTAAAATDMRASGGYDVSFDTGGFVATNAYDLRIGITPQDGKRVILKQCVQNINISSAGDLKVYGKLHKYETATDITRNDTTGVWDGTAATDDTDQTVNFADSNGNGGLEFGINEHVVIAGDSDAAQATTNHMTCRWVEK